MPAPRRPTAAKKTTRIDSAITAPGQLYPSNQTQTVLVTSPQAAKSGDDLALMKFAQLIMYIVALICIWGGILSIAFAGDSTEMNYLILFIGGIISAGMAIGWIEMQSKKNGHQLYEVQNYMLGIGLFFANVGVIWGTRFIMGFATGTMGLELFGTPGEFSNEDWSPNANGIWFQGAGLVALTTVELMILKRYKGEISFGWGIVAYAPVALMLGGVINWMAWSDSLVSYEVGVTMIVMAALSMEMALRSNNTKHFFIVANVAGLLPILYELTNSNAPEQGVGGAISLLLFIIPIMGYYATKPEIKSEVMQKASMGLMALVSFAMLISSANDFNLVLGPIKSATLGEAADYLTLPVMMWIVTLLAFFPAVLDRRVPWMPIGLALMLTLFSEESATIPWLITLAMVPYMLFVNKNARRWVADGTVFALAVSFFLVDLIAKINGIPLEETYGEITLRMQIIIPLALVAISDIGRRMDKISTWPHLSIVAAITLSRTVMDSADWILPWALVVYMLFIAREGLSRAKGSGMKERKDASLVVAISMLATVIMSLYEKIYLPIGADLEASLSGFNIEIFALGLLSYAVFYSTRNVELDFGMLIGWTGETARPRMIFNSETNAWEQQVREDFDQEKEILTASWSAVARLSLIGPLLMMSISMMSIDAISFVTKLYWPVLFLIPVGILTYEFTKLQNISSNARAIGVWTLLGMYFFVSLKVRSIIWAGNIEQEILVSAILLDLIAVSAPILINSIISKRGIDEDTIDYNSDIAAYIGLLTLAVLDISGGLLFIPIYALVAYRAVIHKLNLITSVAPFTLAFVWGLTTSPGILAMMLGSISPDLYQTLSSSGFGPFTVFSGWIMMIHMLAILGLDLKHNEDEAAYPWFSSTLWLALAFLIVLDDAGWIPLLFTILMTIQCIVKGKIEYIPYMPIIALVSFFIGFATSDAAANLDGGMFSLTLLGTAVFTMSIAILDHAGILYRRCELRDDITPSNTYSVYTEAGRENVRGYLTTFSLICYLLSFNAMYGMGTLLGALWITYETFTKGYKPGILLLPAIHCVAIGNFMFQMEMTDEETRTLLTGGILALEGIILLALSLKDDMLYDSEKLSWKDDEEFFAFVDNIGMAGLFYAGTGIVYASSMANSMFLAWTLVTIILIITAMQGFSERYDARWRRGWGGFGSILTCIFAAFSLESSLFRSLGFVMVGVIAFGYAAAFSSRMGEDESITQTAQSYGTLLETAQEMKQEIQEVAQEVTQEIEEAVEDVSEEIESEEELEEMLEEIKDEVEEYVEETTSSIPAPVTKDNAKDFKKKMASAKTSAKSSAVDPSGIIETASGFSLKLPDEVVKNILKTIENTPHEGYKPVVGFNKNGQVVLNFEPLA